jgi:DNA polymerase-3 subunit delta
VGGWKGVDKRIERLVPKENKVIFWELFESQKQGWVNNFFRARGLSVEPEAVDFLLDMVENNTRELQAICERQGGWWRGYLIPGYCESQAATMP